MMLVAGDTFRAAAIYVCIYIYIYVYIYIYI
jgi:hypothetical protein